MSRTWEMSLLFREQPFIEGSYNFSPRETFSLGRCSFGSSLSLRAEDTELDAIINGIASLLFREQPFIEGPPPQATTPSPSPVAALSGAAFH